MTTPTILQYLKLASVSDEGGVYLGNDNDLHVYSSGGNVSLQCTAANNDGTPAVTVDSILTKIAAAALSGSGSGGPIAIANITNLQTTIDALQDLITSSTDLIANSLRVNALSVWNGTTYDTPLSVIAAANMVGGTLNTAVDAHVVQKSGDITVTNYADGRYTITFNIARAAGYVVQVQPEEIDGNMYRIRGAVMYQNQFTTHVNYMTWMENNNGTETFVNWSHNVIVTSL
jgi:hypothetical protein